MHTEKTRLHGWIPCKRVHISPNEIQVAYRDKAQMHQPSIRSSSTNIMRPYLNKKAINIAMTLYTIKIPKIVTSQMISGEKINSNATIKPKMMYGIAITLRLK